MVINGRKIPKYWAYILVIVVLGCAQDQKVSEDIASIPMNVKIDRFDQAFGSASISDIPRLKKQYPYLFPVQYNDSVWEAKLKDTLQIALRKEVRSRFDNFDNEKQALDLLFKHITYYYPKFKAPKILTLTNDVDYQNRIILTDSILFIGLDNYLGPDHEFYQGLSNYIAAGLDREYLVSDVASAYFKTVVTTPRDRDFLSQMIYYGKELYFKDLIMPMASDAQKIGYTQDQMTWAKGNEEPIWRNFIENDLLYSTDNKLAPRFLDQAPFSKFGLELDNESPGRIGRFIGWQIVRSFMVKNELTPQQLFNLSGEEIFKKSNYKPNK